jgi:colicin import membrane protein
MIMKIQAGGPAFPYVLVNNSSETMNTFGIELAPGKTAIEKPGREYLKRLKEAVKPAEEE